MGNDCIHCRSHCADCGDLLERLMDQPMLVAALDTIRGLSKIRSRPDKKRALRAGDSPYLRELLRRAYSRYNTYRLRVGIPVKCSGETADIMPELQKFLDQLATHTVGMNEARRRACEILQACTEEDAKIIASVINRDLDIGVDTAAINEAFPGLLPDFKIQTAAFLSSWRRVKFPIIVDEMLGGVRCIAIYDGDRTRFFTEDGIQVLKRMDAFADEIEQLLPGVPLVFDGVIRASRYNPDDVVCSRRKDGDWQREYARALVLRPRYDPYEIQKYCKFYIWDVVELDYFVSQGRRGRRMRIEDRKTLLTSIFARQQLTFFNIELLRSYLMHSKEQVDAYMKELKGLKRDGCMLKPLGHPYGFGKSGSVIRVYHDMQGTFRILGAYRAGKRGAGPGRKLGSVIIGTDDGKLRSCLSAGFSPDERTDLWVEHLMGRLVGRVVEVQLKGIYQGAKIVGGGKAKAMCRVPCFLRFREDVSTTDTLEGLLMRWKNVKGEER